MFAMGSGKGPTNHDPRLSYRPIESRALESDNFDASKVTFDRLFLRLPLKPPNKTRSRLLSLLDVRLDLSLWHGAYWRGHGRSRMERTSVEKLCAEVCALFAGVQAFSPCSKQRQRVAARGEEGAMYRTGGRLPLETGLRSFSIDEPIRPS
ncbi:hypothetical protein KM043_001412 [Ampulex compressa]|nr:hypothetical protein KM043_001412 [Ampulex compressa]